MTAPLTSAARMGTGFSNDPVLDAERYYGARYEYAERVAAEQARLSALFLAEVASKPLTAPTMLDGKRNDYSAMVDGKPTRRLSTLGEVMFDYLDMPGSATYTELLGLLVRVAKAGDAEAKDMLKRLADKYADHAAEVE